MSTYLAWIDRWRAQHRDCTADIPPTSLEQARFVLKDHGGHGPCCLQYLTASAYYSFGAGDDE
ncbi:hypothetical protein OH799_22250 [Nocardia sp. NBC_00881]|uniref:hypothetical protein n=1 Tax=Nocardia sp. NBC_00881 TaxID=2975995 RepID=UPI00386780A6|nr:hypothetical protein OH799_22250 [Nocardia sp. NBC_00881]